MLAQGFPRLLLQMIKLALVILDVRPARSTVQPRSDWCTHAGNVWFELVKWIQDAPELTKEAILMLTSGDRGDDIARCRKLGSQLVSPLGFVAILYDDSLGFPPSPADRTLGGTRTAAAKRVLRSCLWPSMQRREDFARQVWISSRVFDRDGQGSSRLEPSWWDPKTFARTARGDHADSLAALIEEAWNIKVSGLFVIDGAAHAERIDCS
jgi:hypothetical protein